MDCLTSSQKYYLANKQKVIARAREWRLANPEKARAATRKWQIDNPEHHKDTNRKWTENNREKVAEKTRRYRAKNRHIVQSEMDERKALRCALLEATKAEREQVRKENKRFYQNARRLLKSKSFGNITKNEWILIKKQQRNLCAHCGLKKPLQMDHIFPLKLGGCGYAFNIQGLCRSCNGRKGAKILSGVHASLFDGTNI